MSKTTKIWLIIAAAFLLTGGLVLGSTIVMLKGDVLELSTIRYETNTYEINHVFEDISINNGTADVVFVPSGNRKCSVVCYEQTNLKHTVTVKDNTLTIDVLDTRNWYDYIGINFSAPKTTVYLPVGVYGELFVETDTGTVEVPKDFTFDSIDISASTGDVKNYASAAGSMKLKASTGDIYVQNVSAGNMELSVSTGKVVAADINCVGDFTVKVSTGKSDLKNIRCMNFNSDGNTGDLSMQDVIATGNLSIKRSTGKVKIEGCDAPKIKVETSTGDVTGSLLSEKVFITQTSTGKVDTPKTTTGGTCEITTSTGDIKITIQ